ncbi:MAG: AAA family ATPase, partial [Magnetovibrio sp.]|nr:AAA family ATPase [Magnetovibrio sp.]
MTQSMYQDYFGISENPFSIIPDPRYLYMSQSHQDALAHLVYGVSDSGGFVLLTGEVGTGKTTLCRALIEQLPEDTDLALILNPKLTELELMATICDEMRISYPRDTTSLKAFFDYLTHHLLHAHARGRNPVLLIDEAQNLTTDVMELVRLLTNLETADKKLLQIILVGQPELNATLGLAKMRQTSQRITARYHLTPLGIADTYGYVQHRLNVAGLDTQVFTHSAIKAVYRITHGIPRLINSVCDRSLLAAYVEGKKNVDAKLVARASDEVLGSDGYPSGMSVWGIFILVLAFTMALFVASFDPYDWGVRDRIGYWLKTYMPNSEVQERPTVETKTKSEPVVQPPSEPESVVEAAPEFVVEPELEPEVISEPTSVPTEAPTDGAEPSITISETDDA